MVAKCQPVLRECLRRKTCLHMIDLRHLRSHASCVDVVPFLEEETKNIPQIISDNLLVLCSRCISNMTVGNLCSLCIV